MLVCIIFAQCVFAQFMPQESKSRYVFFPWLVFFLHTVFFTHRLK